MKLGARIFGALAGILIVYLLIGLALPGTWEAEADIRLPLAPRAAFPYLDSTEEWLSWMPMPQTGVHRFGPERGEGSGFRWDDAQYGKGEAEILRSVGDTLVEYRVAVEEGALQIQGTLALRGQTGGSHLFWKESGDFGWNPLLGYAAHKMGESQSTAMHTSLAKLRDLMASGGRAP